MARCLVSPNFLFFMALSSSGYLYVFVVLFEGFGSGLKDRKVGTDSQLVNKS